MTNFIVNSLEDTVIVDGEVTLREAIEAANTNTPVGDAPAGMPGLDTIDFDELLSGGTITSIGGLQITDDLTINGLGADELTISGNDESVIFDVNDENSNNNINVAINGLTIANGVAADGAAFENFENLTINNSTISDNNAGEGGGIKNNETGNLTINNSTISGNSADGGGGGGVFNDRGTVKISNSTLSGNTASGGAAIFNDGGVLEISSSTITGNSASSVGGGIFSSSGSTTVEDTIVAGNNDDVAGDFTSNGYNLIGDDTGSSGFTNGVNGDKVGTSDNPIDPKLGPLQDNGGPTETHALLPGSPAIDMGNPDFTPPPEFDQRGPGFPRVLDGDRDGTAILDIGAFEGEGEADGEVNKAVFSGTGDITTIVDIFRVVVGEGGENNGNEIGSQGEGFREINWDGGAVPFNMPGNFFNNQNLPVNGLPRGVEFGTASNLSFFGVSNPVFPSDQFFGDNEFDTINATYPDQFTTFSEPRLFAPLDFNIMDVDFFEPGVFDEDGDPVPALVTGFGAIFTDVDLPESTKLEFFDDDGDFLFSQFVEPDPQGLSFLGVVFDEAVVSKVRITSGSVPLSRGLDDDPFGTGVDVVAMDNFIYGEPIVA